MAKEVKISRKLFLELIRCHLGHTDYNRELVEKELQEKLDKLAAHERYSRNLAQKQKELP